MVEVLSKNLEEKNLQNIVKKIESIIEKEWDSYINDFFEEHKKVIGDKFDKNQVKTEIKSIISDIFGDPKFYKMALSKLKIK